MIKWSPLLLTEGRFDLLATERTRRPKYQIRSRATNSVKSKRWSNITQVLLLQARGLKCQIEVQRARLLLLPKFIHSMHRFYHNISQFPAGPESILSIWCTDVASGSATQTHPPGSPVSTPRWQILLPTSPPPQAPVSRINRKPIRYTASPRINASATYSPHQVVLKPLQAESPPIPVAITRLLPEAEKDPNSDLLLHTGA
ncbi:hypothetical protein B0J14DRAFT_664681 [Halenospora varia]|nr:hypothetical protein B0J14DRAFT_664681 [Halenospora varia]